MEDREFRKAVHLNVQVDFVWFDPKSRAIWQLICILGGYRPIDTTRSLFRFPCKDSNNAPPLEKKRRLTLNKENSTSFVEIVCRLFNFCLVTSVSKFKFNGLFFNEFDVIIHHWIALFMLYQKSFELNSI